MEAPVAAKGGTGTISNTICTAAAPTTICAWSDCAQIAVVRRLAGAIAKAKERDERETAFGTASNLKTPFESCSPNGALFIHDSE